MLSGFSLKSLAFIAFSAYLIMYVILTLTLLEVNIYPTTNRITIVDATVQWTLTGVKNYDLLVALSCLSLSILFLFKRIVGISITGLVVLLFLVSVSDVAHEKSFQILFFASLPFFVFMMGIYIMKNKDSVIGLIETKPSSLHRPLVIFISVVVVIELVVIGRWSLHPFFPAIEHDHWSWNLNNLESNLFYAFGLLSPHLFLLSTVSFLLRHYLTKPFERAMKFLEQSTSAGNREKNIESSVFLGRAAKVIIGKPQIHLSLIVLMSIVITLYPYAVSGDQGSLGVDIPGYVQTIEQYTYPGEFIKSIDNIFRIYGDRSLSLMIMYSMKEVSGVELETLLKYLPALLAPLLVISVYVFTKRVYSNQSVAVIAAFMAALSHQVVVGFYAAFYSNWMALITMYIASLYLINSANLGKAGFRSIFLFAVFTILTLFLHSYTWTYFIAIITLFLIWSIVQNLKAKKGIRVLMVLGAVTLVIVGIDLLKSQISATTGGFERDLVIAESQTGLDQFAGRWFNLQYAFRIYLGGFFTNSMILLLLFVWTITARYKEPSDKLFLAMIFVALLPILFGDYVVQDRIFFMIPFYVPASIIMYRIMSNPKLSFRRYLFIALLAMQSIYALRAMANMDFELPN